ncbi:hypothetical protein MRB53_009643 [Persea americana]|uniref:Uncharacterized protein n=1 Tax=Persea americana TaxID=3435 RepID=A0ACC2LQS0_PERAE|nr:hypothetical protein MRB53_009643 [Persea americana]
MRTSTEMMTTMRISLLELQTEVVNIKQLLSTTTVRPRDGTNAVAMSTLLLRCSTFDGTDPEIWINEVVSFMNFHQVPREQWVIVATFYLEKEAKRWYNSLLHTQINPITWQSFTESLFARFGPTAFEDHFMQLMHLRQTNSLREYQAEFDRISSMIIDIPQDKMVSAFVGGLKDELRVDVQSQRPKSLFKAISLARLFDDRCYLTQFTKQFSSEKRITASNYSASSSSAAIVPAPPTKPGPRLGLKHMTQEYMNERRGRSKVYEGRGDTLATNGPPSFRI